MNNLCKSSIVANWKTCFYMCLSDTEPTWLPVQCLPRLPSASLWSGNPRAVCSQHGVSSLWSTRYWQQSTDRYTLPAAFHHGEVFFSTDTIHFLPVIFFIPEYHWTYFDFGFFVVRFSLCFFLPFYLFLCMTWTKFLACKCVNT